MASLRVAGGALVGGYGSHRKMMPTPPLGVRALREDLLKPASRGEIPRNLRIIEDVFERDSAVLDPVASEERLSVPRFQHLFRGGELMPPCVFVAALEIGTHEVLNGQNLPFDTEVVVLRDELVMAYKPLAAKIRQVHAKEIDDVPPRLVANFAAAWSHFESAWLRNREVHAVQALQPLSKAILSLEGLLKSIDKERLLPWPRVQHQKTITLKCLEGFMHSLAELASSILPSFSRELDHDPRLLLLMDHVLSLRGERNVITCLEGASATPQVSFPDHQVHLGKGSSSPSGSGPSGLSGALGLGAGLAHDHGKGLTLDRYAFRLLGASVGDAVAAGKMRADHSNGHAGRAKLAMSGTSSKASTLRAPEITHDTAAGGAKESQISRRSAAHATELLVAFEAIKDFLLGLKSTLEHVDPQLDRDSSFVQLLQRFDRAFRRAKKLFLEPDNLA